MDLCVRFQAPQIAIELFEKMHRLTPKGSDSFVVKDQHRQDASIQIGIIIKALGADKRKDGVDKAFNLFKRHQRWLTRTSIEAKENSIFSQGFDTENQQHNDITFGCLIDILVKKGQVQKAE